MIAPFTAMLLLLQFAPGLLAQCPDEVELSKARVNYEATMAQVRERVLAEIRGEKADVEVRLRRRDRFVEAGEWPTMSHNPALADLDQAVSEARRSMEVAYTTSLEALYEKVDLTKRIRAELDVWRSANDLTNWRAVTVPPLTAGKPAGKVAPVVVPCDLTRPYRLEVIGKCATSGPAWLQLPGLDRSLALVVDASGGFHALVTVSAEGFVAADLGVLREAPSPARPMDDSAVVLLAADTMLTSVAWKPAPIDEARLAREAAARLAIEGANREADADAMRLKIDKQVAAMEKKKRDHLSRKPSLESRLATATKNVGTLTARVQQARSSGRDASDLETDLRTWTSKANNYRKELASIEVEVAKVDAEIAKLRGN